MNLERLVLVAAVLCSSVASAELIRDVEYAKLGGVSLKLDVAFMEWGVKPLILPV